MIDLTEFDAAIEAIEADDRIAAIERAEIAAHSDMTSDDTDPEQTGRYRITFYVNFLEPHERIPGTDTWVKYANTLEEASNMVALADMNSYGNVSGRIEAIG